MDRDENVVDALRVRRVSNCCCYFFLFLIDVFLTAFAISCCKRASHDRSIEFWMCDGPYNLFE